MSAVVVQNVLHQGGGAAAASALEPSGDGSRRWSRGKAMFIMRLCNWCNGVLLMFGATVAFLLPTGPLDVEADTIVLSAYVVFLGLLMCCLELNLAMLQAKLRQNFGILFSYTGRACFLLFTASVAAALGTRATYGMHWVLGGLTALNALFNFFVICKHRDFTTGEGLVGGVDPSASVKTAEQAMIDFLVSRPQFAAAVVSSLSRQAIAQLPPEAQAGALAIGAAAGAAASTGMAMTLTQADRAGRVAKAIAGIPLSDMTRESVMAAARTANREDVPAMPLHQVSYVGQPVGQAAAGVNRSRGGTGNDPIVVVQPNVAYGLVAAPMLPQPQPVGGGAGWGGAGAGTMSPGSGRASPAVDAGARHSPHGHAQGSPGQQGLPTTVSSASFASVAVVEALNNPFSGGAAAAAGPGQGGYRPRGPSAAVGAPMPVQPQPMPVPATYRPRQGSNLVPNPYSGGGIANPYAPRPGPQAYASHGAAGRVQRVDDGGDEYEGGQNPFQ